MLVPSIRLQEHVKCRNQSKYGKKCLQMSINMYITYSSVKFLKFAKDSGIDPVKLFEERSLQMIKSNLISCKNNGRNGTGCVTQLLIVMDHTVFAGGSVCRGFQEDFLQADCFPKPYKIQCKSFFINHLPSQNHCTDRPKNNWGKWDLTHFSKLMLYNILLMSSFGETIISTLGINVLDFCSTFSL